jgi:hypothetical protein
MRRFGPKPAESAAEGRSCPVCGRVFAAGDFTTLVDTHPGNEAEAAKMKAGKPYKAIAEEICWSHIAEAPHVYQCRCSATEVHIRCETMLKGYLFWRVRQFASGENTDAESAGRP